MPVVAPPLPSVLLRFVRRHQPAADAVPSMPLPLKHRGVREDVPAPACTLPQSLPGQVPCKEAPCLPLPLNPSSHPLRCACLGLVAPSVSVRAGAMQGCFWQLQ